MSATEQRPEDGNEGWQAERSKLRRGLDRFDVIALLLCAIVGLDTLGATAANGPEGLTWMLIVGLVFFVPYGLLTAELSAAFPVEGGPYVWTKLAYGRFLAGINQVFYWVSNPIWVGGSLCVVAITTFSTFFTPLTGAWQYVAGAAFIWGGWAVVGASVRHSRWVPIAGAVARIVLLSFFLISVVVFAIQNGVQPLDGGGFTPTYLGFVALFPILIFNYMGFEIPSAASDEIGDPKRDIPFALLRSGLAAIVLYGGPILGILLVLPAEQLGTLGGFIDACRSVFTVYGGEIAADGSVTLTGVGAVLGKIAAAGLIVGLFTSGIAWATGLNRSQAVACIDGAGPAWLGQFSAKHGTPARVNLVSAVVSTIIMVAALALTHGDAQKYFTAGIGLVISAAAISYLLTFSSFIVLRRKYPDVDRPYRVPGGSLGAWAVTVLAVGSVFFTVVQLLWPGLGVGWFGTSGRADDYLPEGFGGQRTGYTLSQLVPLLAIAAIGCLMYALGAPGRARDGARVVPDATRDQAPKA